MNPRRWKLAGQALVVPAIAALCMTVLFGFAASDTYAAQPAIEESGGRASNESTIPAVLQAKRWSPYVVGAGIGILIWLTFLLSDKPLGISSAFARTSGMIEERIGDTNVEDRKYYRKFPPQIDWEWMLVGGVVVGALLSAALSGSFRLDWVPSTWREMLGETPVVRWAVALLGGIIMGIGARWARGCTSGHGLSGALQLAVSSWIAVVCFFIGGVATALLLFKIIFAG